MGLVPPYPLRTTVLWRLARCRSTTCRTVPTPVHPTPPCTYRNTLARCRSTTFHTVPTTVHHPIHTAVLRPAAAVLHITQYLPQCTPPPPRTYRSTLARCRSSRTGSSTCLGPHTDRPRRLRRRQAPPAAGGARQQLRWHRKRGAGQAS